MSGPVPVSIGSLTGLTHVDLSSNALQGTLPSSFANLTLLNLSTSKLYLAVSGLCSATGAVPGGYETNDGPLPGCAPPAPPPLPTFTCNDTDDNPAFCAALGVFYTALSGSAWGSNKGWLNASQGIPTDYCSFFGVFCDRSTVPFSSPTIINLQSNLLEGMLPGGLSAITTLRALRFNDNLLDGALPSLWGDLTKLTQLWLYNNYISGSIPST